MSTHVDPDQTASEKTSYASFSIISTILQTGQVFVIVLEGQKPGKMPQIQLPGGGGLPGETPESTLQREVVVEIMDGEPGKEIQPAWGKIVKFRTVSCDGDLSKGGGTHYKHFFLVSFSKPLTELRKWDGKPETDGTILSRPRNLDIEEILGLPNLKRAHREVLEGLFGNLKSKVPAIKEFYGQ